jgi:hypothetical protein
VRVILTIFTALGVIAAALLFFVFAQCAAASDFGFADRTWFTIGAVICLALLVGGISTIARLNRSREDL